MLKTHNVFPPRLVDIALLYWRSPNY